MVFRVQTLLPAIALTLLPSSALAFEYFTVGVGGQFQAGGNFLDKPDDQTVPIPSDAANQPRPEYPGFAGLTLGGGPFIDLRALGYVGVEIGLLFTTDKGEADIDVTDLNTGQTTNFTVEMQHSALHIPLLIKGSLPGEYVSPNIFVGPEFVIPSDPVVVATPARTDFRAFQDGGSYTMVSFGLGLEFKLPIPFPDDIMSIRIPFSLRGSVNPGVSEKRIERAQHCGPNSATGACDPIPDQANGALVTEYKTEWKFQAVANLGAAIHF